MQAPPSTDGSALQLPAWTQADERRRGHIARVVAMLDQWSTAIDLPREVASAWHDAGAWHDALRDAPEPLLRELAARPDLPAPLLHGPAAATQLERDGEMRRDVIDAVRWHTIGSPAWGRTGRALYMADYLEPGRSFARVDRAYLAAQVPHDFEATFRQVVRQRVEWALREGNALYPETAALWNSVR